jgi:hypothetical protein
MRLFRSANGCVGGKCARLDAQQLTHQAGTMVIHRLRARLPYLRIFRDMCSVFTEALLDENYRSHEERSLYQDEPEAKFQERQGAGLPPQQ